MGANGGQRTKDELLNGRVDVHAHGHLELVDLELQPLAEGLELGSHGGQGVESGWTGKGVGRVATR